MLSDREDIGPAGLAVPAGDPREPMRDVRDLDVERRGVEQIEPPPRQHPLPDPRVGCGRLLCRHLTLRRGVRCVLPQVSWQKQVTRWSLTMPVACMKA